MDVCRAPFGLDFHHGMWVFGVLPPAWRCKSPGIQESRDRGKQTRHCGVRYSKADIPRSLRNLFNAVVAVCFVLWRSFGLFGTQYGLCCTRVVLGFEIYLVTRCCRSMFRPRESFIFYYCRRNIVHDASCSTAEGFQYCLDVPEQYTGPIRGGIVAGNSFTLESCTPTKRVLAGSLESSGMVQPALLGAPHSHCIRVRFQLRCSSPSADSAQKQCCVRARVPRPLRMRRLFIINRRPSLYFSTWKSTTTSRGLRWGMGMKTPTWVDGAVVQYA